VAALIERHGRVLLDLRRRGTHLEGRWEFPGGKCEAGETDEAALIRELGEELGVAAEVTGPAVAAVEHHYDTFDLTLVLYPVRIDGEPRSLDVEAIGWFLPEALAALPMPPADGPLVAAVLGRLRGEKA
jgi:8-oxo-dGTP diphosphatase